MVIVFRGTETTKEWVENATVFMEHLDGAERESCMPGWNRGVRQPSVDGSPFWLDCGEGGGQRGNDCPW